MTHKEQVEKKIRELCPELQELSFGCEVKGTQSVPTVRYVGYSNSQHAFQAILPDGGEALLLVDKVEPETIIGHPIELRHVLRASKIVVHMTQVANDDWNMLEMDAGEYGMARYNLTLPFDENMKDPALVEFLHSILCGKE